MFYELELSYKALEFDKKFVSAFYETLEECKKSMDKEIEVVCESYFKSYPALKNEWECFKKEMYSKNLYKKGDLYAFLRAPNGSVYEWRIKKFYD